MAGKAVLARGLGDHLSSLLPGPVSVPAWVSSQHGSWVPRGGEGPAGSSFKCRIETGPESRGCLCGSETALCLAQIEGGEEIDPTSPRGIEQRLYNHF